MTLVHDILTLIKIFGTVRIFLLRNIYKYFLEDPYHQGHLNTNCEPRDENF